MSIWIDNKLAPHSYEKTLVSLRKAREEQLIVWIEGTNCKLSFKDKRRIVKLYTAMLKDEDCKHISKEDMKKMAQTFVELEIKYKLDELNTTTTNNP